MKRLMITLLVFVIGCSSANEETEKKLITLCDIDCKTADMSAYDTFTEKNHVFIESNFTDTNQKLMDPSFTGIIYYGYPSCPWCEEVVPIMNEVAKKQKLQIYYVNKKSDVNVNNKKGEEEAIQILNEAYGLEKNKEEKLTLFVPEVVVVKEGKIIDHHAGTVDGQDAHKRKMNEDEIRLLKRIYTTLFKQVY